MKYEVVELSGEWAVCLDGVEVARHAEQFDALNDVTERLRNAENDGSYSLAMRYQARG